MHNNVCRYLFDRACNGSIGCCLTPLLSWSYVCTCLTAHTQQWYMVSQVLGSVYIAEVNYIMMVLTVIVVAVFKTTVQLGNAYGGIY